MRRGAADRHSHAAASPCGRRPDMDHGNDGDNGDGNDDMIHKQRGTTQYSIGTTAIVTILV